MKPQSLAKVDSFIADMSDEKSVTPYILCFDEAHKLCPLSW